jgi:hypothetical protein
MVNKRTPKQEMTVLKQRSNRLGADFRVESVSDDLDDLWVVADTGARPQYAVTIGEMDAAKIRRKW